MPQPVSGVLRLKGVVLESSSLHFILEKKYVLATSVQSHPEAGLEPHDARYLFGQFVEMMSESRTLRV